MKYIGEEIYKVIPNRYPLMILDSLDIFENGGKGEIYLKKDMWFFKCHYPDYPVLPLTMLIESMTQVFSATFLSKTEKQEIPLLISIDNIKMKTSAFPGDKLRLMATLASFRRGVAKGSVKAFKNEDEQPICEFEMVEVLPSQMVRVK